MKSFIVVDQNTLRSERLTSLISDRRDVNFVFVDAAIMELCKSDAWERTMRRSLEALAKCPERVHAAIGLGEAFRIEVATKRSVAGKMLSRSHRSLIRDLLAAVLSGGRGIAMEAIAHSHERVADDLRSNELNHVKNKLDLKELIDSLLVPLGVDFLKGLRNGAVSRSERLALVVKAAPHLISEFFSAEGFSPSKTKEFLRRKPLLLRQVYAKILLCLNWLARGGFESLRPEAATNDVIDQEYVVVATFFNGLLSRESRVNELYQDLCEILAIKPNEYERYS